MPSIDSIAAEYVERTVALDPSFATWAVPLDQARRRRRRLIGAAYDSI